MTSKSIPRIAEAAAVIRDLVGFDFEWEAPGDRQYGRGAMMLLLHEPGSPMRAWCNYDCREYDKIDKVRGLEITVVTTARNDEQGRRLLQLLGMPFAKKGA